MAGIRLYLDFKTEGQGKQYVNELAGFDAAPFALRREEGRMAVDVSYVGGADAQFTMTPMAQPRVFERTISYLELYGQEAEVVMGFELGADDYQLGVIDFAEAETDMLTFFTFKVIETGKKATFKRRKDIPTNVTGYFSLDDKPVTPLSPKRIFAPAKPLVQISEWDAPFPYLNIGASTAITPLTGGDYVISNISLGVNPSYRQQKYGIDGSLSFLAPATSDKDSFIYIEARENLTNVKIELKDVAIRIRSIILDGFDLITSASGNAKLIIKIGDTFSTAQTYVMHQRNFIFEDSAYYSFPTEYVLPIQSITRTKKVWIYLDHTTQATFNEPFGVQSARYFLFTDFSQMTVRITATSTAASSVVYGLRMEDVMKKNAEISADISVSAPRWATNGEFQNEHITNQNLIRNILDKPVNITTKFIAEEYLTFCKGDYQVKENEVFYGREPDFYRNVQCGKFIQVQSNTYRRKINPKYLINQFAFGYSNFQSQKENETANTQDEVHGNLKLFFPSKKVENKVDVKIGVIRSAFSFEQARRKAFELAFENKETAATQDDDKFYSIDAIPLETNSPKRNQKYTAALQHQASPMRLVLTNKDDFSWLLLGIENGDPFTITEGANIRSYTVSIVTDQTITLIPTIFTDQLQNVAENNTTFTYRIGNSTTLVLRTNEGFASIEGLSEGNVYPNLLYTTKRCIMNYWQAFLSTCLAYNPFKDIKVVDYNNNPDAFTRLTSEAVGIKEGDRFTPTGRIFSGIVHEGISLQMTWEQYKEMEQAIINDRGWIETVDSNGLPIYGFISDVGEYVITSIDEEENLITGIYTCNLEEMYMPGLVDLFYADGQLLINGKIVPSDTQFMYDEYQRLSIFDANGKRLYPAVLWNKVKYNGIVPQTLEELIQFTDSI